MPLTVSQKTDVPKMVLDQFFQYCNTYTRADAADAHEGGWTWTAVNSDVKVDIQPASSMSEQLKLELQGENIAADFVGFFLSTVATITAGDSVGIAADGGVTEDTYYTVVGVYDWDSHIEVALESGRSDEPT